MRHPVPERYREIWGSVLHLGAPVSGSVITRNLMRTTDVLVAAALSPSAVASLAVADLYRQVQGRIGGGIGGGAVALASQDTGVGLGWGVAGALVGLVACYVLMLAVSAWGYARTDWAGRTTELLADRGSVDG